MRRQITADFSKSVEQHRQHRVDLHQGLRRRCESIAEPVLEQAIKKPRGGWAITCIGTSQEASSPLTAAGG